MASPDQVSDQTLAANGFTCKGKSRMHSTQLRSWCGDQKPKTHELHNTIYNAPGRGPYIAKLEPKMFNLS